MADKTYPKVTLDFKLTAKSRIGVHSGEQAELTNAEQIQSEGNTLTYAQLMLDVNKRPMLPGSSLKGVLRALFEPKMAQALFGGQQREGNSAQQAITKRFNGCVSVQSAFLMGTNNSEKAVTYQTHNSIDAITDTVLDNHLFSQAWVNSGGQFKGQLHAEFISETQLKALCSVLKIAQLQVGAGSKWGYGQVELSDLNVKVLSAEKLTAWFKSDNNDQKKLSDFYDDFKLENLPSEIGNITSKTLIDTWQFDLHLSSPDPILIACPEHLKMQNKPHKTEQTMAAYFVREEGKPILPASALRGMLRARFIKIICTLLPQIDCKTLQQFVTPFWGSTAQRSALIIPNATLTKEATAITHPQSMIAIDRFTGGVKDGALINVEAVTVNGDFKTACSIPMAVLKAHPFSTAVLMLVFKDLLEQKMAIGANKNRGYGRIKGKFFAHKKEYTDIQDVIDNCLAHFSSETLEDSIKKTIKEYKTDSKKEQQSEGATHD
ncbi:RAMP superfamily CRISPR-associated protein [Pseudoalteromonas rhizosphaerae]|uniref:RAMP superfamily CRISPR-associated protein n=1 Tax=Pseudoalteromonas rhizosphaerae TaxID=2518973 RepID=UPI0021475B5C|nr:RAMP superfamily CRISPR-associated protein [Pseudoalteromonas rhizosphaerae]